MKLYNLCLFVAVVSLAATFAIPKFGAGPVIALIVLVPLAIVLPHKYRWIKPIAIQETPELAEARSKADALHHASPGRDIVSRSNRSSIREWFSNLFPGEYAQEEKDF